MPAKRHFLAAATLALGLSAVTADAAGPFTLQSKTFQDGHVMPKKVANSQANMSTNPNCVGDNVSPELSWGNVPDGTKSLAFLMFDPEGRAPGGVSHWVAYGIPATVTGFAEGETSVQTDKYVGGKSTPGLAHYFGPCTPAGAPHHYTFTLIATDLEPTALQAGMTRDELMKALDGHAKGATGIIGTFSKP